MSAHIFVMYPQPTDVDKFEQDYREHLDIYAEHLPDAPKPIGSRIKSAPDKPAPYYMVVSIPYENIDALNTQLKSEGMQKVGAHAHKISSGGTPVILIGSDN